MTSFVEFMLYIFRRPLKPCFAYPPQKIFVCMFPKAACSTWTSLLVAATEKFGRKFPQWKNATNYTDEMRNEVIHFCSHTCVKGPKIGLNNKKKQGHTYNFLRIGT